MLDGAARIKDVVRKAAEDGQPGIGITDHGNMYGVLPFYTACREAGITPIIGMEAYQAGESRLDRPPRRGREDDNGGEGEAGQKLYYHLLVLAESFTGYRNLIQLSSKAFLEGYHYQPRLDWELLEQHHEGLVATTSCLGGVVLQDLLRDDFDGGLAKAARLQDIFGRDNLFVEIQDHGIEEQRRTNPLLLEIAKKLNAPLLATNDSHYTEKEDCRAHDALLCVQTNSQIDDEKRFRFSSPDQHYLKSAAEMRHLFGELPEACDNTLWIAERASGLEIPLGGMILPNFPIPEPFTGEDDYLRHLVEGGAKARYGDPIPAHVQERIDYELSIIGSMGLSAYFLVVWDLIRYARERKIRVGPGRGSAAGCAVSYCLRITDIDPLRFGLIFERFLDPSRKEMPDIDMDFDERYRGELIKYTADRYGHDRVAQIVTFSTIKARAAVRDAARVLGFPYMVGDRIAKAMPPLIMGRDTPLAACLEKTPEHADGYGMAAELRQIYAEDQEARQVIDVAKGLEGLRRQAGIHAAAVVISRDPLTEYLPLQRKPDPGGDPAAAPIVTQYEMGAVADLGLLKMDFLGLRNLSVIERALDLIEANTGERPDIDNLPLDDEAVFAMLRRGDSMGVFQLEGRAMRDLMRSLAPTCFEDISALVALYRPGPMAANMHNDFADRKNGRKPITYLHEDLGEVLGETQGLMIYQESLMRVAQKFAGYSMAEAGRLRKACAKKKRDLIAKERDSFLEGCKKTGYGEAIGKALFDIIEPFADYAFPKAHAFAYGFVSYQTAWLKAHFPVEYFAALLTSVRDDKDKTAVYLSECRSKGIPVEVPDVNVSEADFTARRPLDGSPPSIRFGMAAVRNVGGGLVAHIVAEREANGPFTDFWDFCKRVDPTVLNKRTLDSLIKAGGFDSLGHTRMGLSLVFEEEVDRILARRREYEMGVMSLFGDDSGADGPSFDERARIGDQEFDKNVRLRLEKEMLGLYISDHPLRGVEAALRRHSEVTIAELRAGAEAAGGEQGGGDAFVPRWVGGVVTGLSRRYTKRGELMGTFTLEDLGSAIDAWVFPKTMLTYGSLLQEDEILCVKGRLDLRDETPKLVVMEVRKPVLVGGQPLHLKLPVATLGERDVSRLKELLVRHPGPSPIVLELAGKLWRLPADWNVDDTNGLVGELRELFGAGCIA
jgi:DNA polymerase III subunit alpha